MGAPHDALSTLRHLVETGREAGETDAVRGWCRRADDLLERVPEVVVEDHRAWIHEACGERE